MGHELDLHDDTTWDAKISSVEWQQNECTIEIVVHAHIICHETKLPWHWQKPVCFSEKNHVYTVQLPWA